MKKILILLSLLSVYVNAQNFVYSADYPTAVAPREYETYKVPGYYFSALSPEVLQQITLVIQHDTFTSKNMVISFSSNGSYYENVKERPVKTKQKLSYEGNTYYFNHKVIIPFPIDAVVFFDFEI